MAIKKTKFEKVKGTHYDILAGISTIAILDSIAERKDIPRKAIFPILNAVKYLLRCGAKPGESWEDDVAKAENYLHRARTGGRKKEAR
jgi:hypothetical protein